MLIERICLLEPNADGVVPESVDIPMGPGKLHRNQPDLRHVKAGRTRVWRFKSNESGALVCDVTHEEDIRRLLSIREGYLPYGDEAEAEAKTKFKWRATSAAAPVDPKQKIVHGQPEVKDVFEDDEDPGAPDGDDDEGDDNEIAAHATEPGDLPPVPAESADGDEWMAYGTRLVGATKAKDMKVLLAEYAEANYGLPLDRSKGILVLLKQVAEAQMDAEAA